MAFVKGAYDWKHKVVVVTGASTGIGAAFARELAARGAHLVLVARGQARLQALAEELAAAHRVEPTVLALDLATPGASAHLLAQLRERGLGVDVLINNAGFGTYGSFGELSGPLQREEIDLNVGALVELTHAFMPDVLARQGGFIQVASTAAFQPVPYMAVYAATKAFVLSFSEALWGEYRSQGVRVLALCPGATETPFFERVGSDAAALGKRATPEAVVRTGLGAFARNRSYVIHGTANYLIAQSTRLATREMSIKLTARIMGPARSPIAADPAISKNG